MIAIAKPSRIKSITASLCTLSIVGCSSLPTPPPGLESDRSFSSSSSVPYQDAYRSVARRSTACFGQGGFLSTNHSVQADLDATKNTGQVEVFPVGLFSGEDKDSDRKSYITTIKAKGEGSEIMTTGPTRNGAYIVHAINMQWVAGTPSCKLER